MLSFAGCHAETDSAPAATAEVGLAKLGKRTDMTGARLDLESADAIVVVVFASWCAPCRRELAALSELRAGYPGVTIVGLNAYEEFDDFSDEKKLRAFLAAEVPWLTVVRDDGTLLETFGGVPKIPTLFIFDRDGKLVHEFRRNKRPPPNKQELAAAIDSAVKRGAS